MYGRILLKKGAVAATSRVVFTRKASAHQLTFLEEASRNIVLFTNENQMRHYCVIYFVGSLRIWFCAMMKIATERYCTLIFLPGSLSSTSNKSNVSLKIRGAKIFAQTIQPLSSWHHNKVLSAVYSCCCVARRIWYVHHKLDSHYGRFHRNGKSTPTVDGK